MRKTGPPSLATLYPLALRDEFYEFLRTEYLPNHALPHLGAQDYTAIVLQAEIGARTSELLGIRSSGESCDIDWQTGRVRLFGKGKAFSGKRVRTVPLTPFAMEVLRVFEKIFKPMFPRQCCKRISLSRQRWRPADGNTSTIKILRRSLS